MSTQRAVHWQLVVLAVGCALAVAAVAPAAPATGAGPPLSAGAALAIASVVAGEHRGTFGLPVAALCGLADSADGLPYGPVDGPLAALVVGPWPELGCPPAPAGLLLRPAWYPLRC